MGERVRCPKCNRYGAVDLGNYCKSCYQKPYEKPTKRDQLIVLRRKYPTVVKNSMLEVGKVAINTLTDNEVNIVLNYTLRRLPVKRTGHLVRGASPMESHGYGFVDEPGAYGVERGEVGYEHGDME